MYTLIFQECNTVCNTWDQTSSIYQMGPCTPAQNLNQSSSNMSRFYGNISAAASPQVSPLRSFSGRINSPAFMSHSQSPLASNPPGLDRLASLFIQVTVTGKHNAITFKMIHTKITVLKESQVCLQRLFVFATG